MRPGLRFGHRHVAQRDWQLAREIRIAPHWANGGLCGPTQWEQSEHDFFRAVWSNRNT